MIIATVDHSCSNRVHKSHFRLAGPQESRPINPAEGGGTLPSTLA